MMTPDRESCWGVMSRCDPRKKLNDYAGCLACHDLFWLRAKRRGEIALQKYLLIAVGGALGSVMRYWVGSTVGNRMGFRFPYGTLLVNMTACLVIGFSMTFLERRADFNPAWRFLIPIGLIGAYSTFSTFEWDTLAQLRSGAFFMAALYAGGSLILGLIAVWGGAVLADAL
jgi:fluoride exporter